MIKTSAAHGDIQRTERVLSQKPGLSRFTQTCINQAIIEQTLIDLLGVDDRLSVERNVVTESLSTESSLAEKQDAYPVTIKVCHTHHTTAGLFQNLGEDSRPHSDKVMDDPRQDHAAIGRMEVIKAKYVLACDGAHSWTRKQLGLTLDGEQINYVWGVLDIIPLTDFPDIRQASIIHSAKAGSILSVPREDKLIRLYIQLGLEDDAQNRKTITPKTIIKKAQEIMSPYRIDYKYCDWWSLYKIGQRIAPTFSVDDRVFLAGDAVHTHSPKLGQGMNISMQDTYNLVWKLGSVICGSAKPVILSTYNFERRQVALDLLDCDRQIARFYAGKTVPGTPRADDISDMPDFSRMREKMHEFLAGTGITYRPSVLIASSDQGPIRLGEQSWYCRCESEIRSKYTARRTHPILQGPQPGGSSAHAPRRPTEQQRPMAPSRLRRQHQRSSPVSPRTEPSQQSPQVLTLHSKGSFYPG